MKKAYRVATRDERIGSCDESYDLLLGPNGFECCLTEPEDRRWERDAEKVVDKLNEQHDLLRRAMAIITDAIMHGMPITKEVAAVRDAIVVDNHASAKKD